MRTLTDIVDIEDRIDLEEVFHHVDKTTQMLSNPVNATLNHTGEVHMRHEVPLRVVTVSPSEESHACLLVHAWGTFLEYGIQTENNPFHFCSSRIYDVTTWVFIQERYLERYLLCVLVQMLLYLCVETRMSRSESALNAAN